MTTRLSNSNAIADPSKPLVWMTADELERLMEAVLAKFVLQQKAEQDAGKRLTTKEAAKYLGYTTGFMQKLHQRGLPYEKGRPNFYKLADLEKYRAALRLNG